ncbi:MAG: RAD55 family ATPase [Halobacteriales archaeon]|nr:RAD55 family ATPase [Halobacteriales archaeon]
MRVSSGVRGFDSLVDGGLPAGRLYIVSGPPGSGKTTFTAHFLTQGAQQGERCFYLSMHESKEELVNDMGNYQFDFAKYMNTDRIEFLNVFANQGRRVMAQSGGGRSGPIDVEDLASKIINYAESEGTDRIVIDSMMLLEHFFEETSENVIKFLTSLKQTDATVLLISETTDPTSYSDEHYLAHGVIFLHNYLDGDGMTRGIQIVKMRGTPIDCDIRQITFSDSGLRVEPSAKVKA